MTVRRIVVLVSVAFASVTAFADSYAYLCRSNGIGDRSLVAVDGVRASFATKTEVDLIPTNAPAGNFTIQCRVVYADPDMPLLGEPAAQLAHYEKVNELLELWLRDCIATEHVGAEFNDLAARYYEGDVAKSLDDAFSQYARAHIADAEDGGVANVDVIMVEVEASQDLRQWLLKMHQDELEKASAE